MQRQALVNHVTNRSGRSLDQARYLIRLLTDVSSETSVDIVRFALFGLLWLRLRPVLETQHVSAFKACVVRWDQAKTRVNLGID